MTSESAQVAQTSPHHWQYVAEGGSTVVFSYSGPRNLHFDGTVLRLRKSPIASELSDAYDQTIHDADDPTVDFQQQVIQRIVPAEFLPHLEHVHVDRQWLETMVAVHDHVRPLTRREKDKVDLTRTKAVLATDLIGNHGWAVEIKVGYPFYHLLCCLTRIFCSQNGDSYPNRRIYTKTRDL
jgi:inositol-pentakisphosphate 2-kinase